MPWNSETWQFWLIEKWSSEQSKDGCNKVKNEKRDNNGTRKVVIFNKQ